jgi:hypothetical protein
MDTGTSEQIYQPLVNQPSFIRLLKFEPSSSADDAIKCSLTETCLDDDPIYDALSYVWGTAEPPCWIFLNGIQKQVTPNLFEALKVLKDSTKGRSLWVDALCINQDDRSERSQQVQLMGQIYSKAERVLAWLGAGTNVQLQSALHDYRSHRNEYMYDLSRYIRDPGDRMPAKFGDVILSPISQNPYWSRAWVVQEFILAKEVVLLYGTAWIEVELISQLRDNREIAGRVIMQEHRMSLGDEGFNKGHGRFSRRISDTAYSLSNKPYASEPMESLCLQRRHFCLGESGSGCVPELLELLRCNYRRQCTEPRDIIYSLLHIEARGPARSNRAKIRVDYDKSVWTLLSSLLPGLFPQEHVFEYATAMKRLLRIIPETMELTARKTDDEEWVDVAGRQNGEVIGIEELDQDMLDDAKFSELVKGTSAYAQLSQQFLAETTMWHIWNETWFEGRRTWNVAGQTWNEEPPIMRSRTEVEEVLPRLYPDQHGQIPITEHLERIVHLRPTALTSWSTIADSPNTRLQSVKAKHLQKACQPPPVLKLALLKFKSYWGCTVKQDNEYEHHFQAHYCVGIAYGTVKMGDRTVSFKGLEPAFTLGEDGMTGLVQWVYNPDRCDLGRLALPLKQGEWPSEPIGHTSDYIHPSVELRLTADEVLRLAPD